MDLFTGAALFMLGYIIVTRLPQPVFDDVTAIIGMLIATVYYILREPVLKLFASIVCALGYPLGVGMAVGYECRHCGIVLPDDQEQQMRHLAWHVAQRDVRQ